MARAARARPVAAAILLFAFLLGNSIHLWKFLTIGRGHYRDAAEYLVANTPGPIIALSSDHESRTKMVLWHYFSLIPMNGKTPYYIPYDSPQAPDWLMLHSQDIEPIIAPQIRGPWKATYQLEETYSYYGLSGWHWLLYRRIT